MFSFPELEAGLPNITGGWTALGGSSSNQYRVFKTWSGWSHAGDWTGALKVDRHGARLDMAAATGSDGWEDASLSFDASKSSPIYGNSSTVQPPAIQLIPQIKC